MLPTELAPLAASTAAYLAAHMAALLQFGGKASEEVVKKLVDAGADGVKALWARLHPALAERPEAAEAARDVAEDPTNDRAVGALSWQIEKVLKEDSGLAADIAKLLKECETGGARVKNTGNCAVVAGGKISGIVVTGDGNTVGKI